MSNSIQEIVGQRASVVFDTLTHDLRNVSVRLPEYRIQELDLLASYLGYTSRQQVTAAILGAAVDDALQALSEALSATPDLHAQYTADRLEILECAE